MSNRSFTIAWTSSRFSAARPPNWFVANANCWRCRCRFCRRTKDLASETRTEPELFLLRLRSRAEHFAKAAIQRCVSPSGCCTICRGRFSATSESSTSESITSCSRALADSTTGSVVMVGPSTKVDPKTFPQRDESALVRRARLRATAALRERVRCLPDAVRHE